MVTYKSKIDAALLIPIGISMGTSVFLMVFEKSLPGFLILLATTAFVAHMFATTFYTVDGPVLKIKCGFLYNRTLAITSIYKIEETSSLLSAPATSLDRIEVFYNRFDSVVVSPKDKRGFVNELTAINPAIEVLLKS